MVVTLIDCSLSYVEKPIMKEVQGSERLLEENIAYKIVLEVLSHLYWD